jgi:hypothetical protein
MKQRIFPGLVTVLLLASLACRSLPFFSTPAFTSTPATATTPTESRFLIPAPNLTLTELFRAPPTETFASANTKTTAPTESRFLSPTPNLTITELFRVPTDSNCTNLARFISETIPDYTYIAPGTAFVKSWTLKNIGTCAWGEGYALVFDGGDPMGGPDSVSMTSEVPPGATNTFTVHLTAPATSGVFQGFWKIRAPQGVRFGIEPDGKTAIWVKITTIPPD